ncbi:hypothetical protein [Mesorhizobium sp. SEMIA 3007]|uniref:hypothetical protein n=1 Tax=Mesorhizobium sp. SEMIA 3007 TaxID=1862350 RepID=UPI00114D2236|nr:hypothetical protein [Mesorhizobium sp. SEMIA 3007]
MLGRPYLMSDRSHRPDSSDCCHAGAVSDDGEPDRVADGRRDVFFDGLFACNVANCARSLAADGLDPSVVSFNVDSVRPVVVTIALSTAKAIAQACRSPAPPLVL